MFNRKSAQTTPAVSVTKDGGKGRPTPTRKEAEAARKAQAKKPVTRREQASARSASTARAREAMKTGDERYLPTRDKGPVKRFTRDYVDSKFMLPELAIPLLVVAMVAPYVGAAAGFVNVVMTLILLAIAVNLVALRFLLFKQVRRRFPEASTRGLTSYLLLRALQLRFLRLPKPQIKIGSALPETYR